MSDARPARSRRLLAGLRDAATRNVPLKLLALLLAFGLWAFVNFGERATEEALKIPVQFRNIPPQLMITSPRVDFVDVRVVGPRTLLGRIDYNQLVIPLDFSGARPGPAVFTVNVDRLNLPRGVRVVRVTPAQITATLERVRRKTVPVQLRIEGEPPADFRVVATRVIPPEVEISGPVSLVAPIDAASTDTLTLDETAQSTIDRELPLEPLGEYVTPRPGGVRVVVEIEEIRIDRTLAAVPVEIEGQTADEGTELQLEPNRVAVTIRGPRRVVDTIVSDGLATVDSEGLTVGEHELSVRIDVPEEAELVLVEPASVQLTVALPTPTPVPMSPQEAGATPLQQPVAGVMEEAAE